MNSVPCVSVCASKVCLNRSGKGLCSQWCAASAGGAFSFVNCLPQASKSPCLLGLDEHVFQQAGVSNTVLFLLFSLVFPFFFFFLPLVLPTKAKKVLLLLLGPFRLLLGHFNCVSLWQSKMHERFRSNEVSKCYKMHLMGPGFEHWQREWCCAKACFGLCPATAEMYTQNLKFLSQHVVSV